MGCLFSYPVVSSLVLVVDPVEFLIGAVLHRVLGYPLIRVTASLGQDPRNRFDLLQVNLKPLVGILELRQPSTPGTREGEKDNLCVKVAVKVSSRPKSLKLLVEIMFQ